HVRREVDDLLERVWEDFRNLKVGDLKPENVLLADAGITEMPTTWDQLTADAKATTTGDRGGFVHSPRRGAWLRPFAFRRNGYRFVPGAVLLSARAAAHLLTDWRAATDAPAYDVAPELETTDADHELDVVIPDSTNQPYDVTTPGAVICVSSGMLLLVIGHQVSRGRRARRG
ncbi:hypothetical protein IAE22_30450, partial [Bacillus sp. S34]|nr:hypothetical protein [Bacillus sp. S34]